MKKLIFIAILLCFASIVFSGNTLHTRNAKALEEELLYRKKSEDLQFKLKRTLDDYNELLLSCNENNYHDYVKYLQSDKDDIPWLTAKKLVDIAILSNNEGTKRDISQILVDNRRFKFDEVYKISKYLGDETKEKWKNKKMFGYLSEFNVRSAVSIIMDFIGTVEKNEDKSLEKDAFRKNTNEYREQQRMKITKNNAIFALARMGDRKSIDNSIEIFHDNNNNSEGYPAFENLSFIRQPETIDIISIYIYDDPTIINKYKYNKEIDHSFNINNLAVKHLRDCIIGFPPKKGGAYEDLRNCRKWMKENYNPHLIKSHSVLIDGKLYDNIDGGEPIDLKTNPIFNQSTEFKTDTPTENVKENPKPEKKDNNIPNP